MCAPFARSDWKYQIFLYMFFLRAYPRIAGQMDVPTIHKPISGHLFQHAENKAVTVHNFAGVLHETIISFIWIS